MPHRSIATESIIQKFRYASIFVESPAVCSRYIICSEWHNRIYPNILAIRQLTWLRDHVAHDCPACAPRRLSVDTPA